MGWPRTCNSDVDGFDLPCCALPIPEHTSPQPPAPDETLLLKEALMLPLIWHVERLLLTLACRNK